MLDSYVKEKQRNGNRGLRQADFVQRVGETKAVQQAESERDNSRAVTMARFMA